MCDLYNMIRYNNKNTLRLKWTKPLRQILSTDKQTNKQTNTQIHEPVYRVAPQLKIIMERKSLE